MVQIHQTFGHILKNGDLRAERDIGCALQKLAQAALQSLRDQHREPGVGEETDAQKLDDVRVAEVGEKTTYFVVLFHHALSALALEVDDQLRSFIIPNVKPSGRLLGGGSLRST